jgi:hypothetical protein
MVYVRTISFVARLSSTMERISVRAAQQTAFRVTMFQEIVTCATTHLLCWKTTAATVLKGRFSTKRQLSAMIILIVGQACLILAIILVLIAPIIVLNVTM